MRSFQSLHVVMMTTILLASVAASAQVSTQNRRSVKTSTRLSAPVDSSYRPQGQHLLSIDAVPMLTSGVGARYDYILNSHFGLGVFVDTAELKSSTDDKNTSSDMKARLNRFGARGSLFSRHPSEGAWYASLGAASASGKLQATGGLTGTAQEKDLSGVGLAAGAGYLIAGAKIGQSSKLMVNLGLNYMYGNRVETQITETRSWYSTTMDMDAKIASSVGFDIGLGLLF